MTQRTEPAYGVVGLLCLAALVFSAWELREFFGHVLDRGLTGMKPIASVLIGGGFAGLLWLTYLCWIDPRGIGPLPLFTVLLVGGVGSLVTLVSFPVADGEIAIVGTMSAGLFIANALGVRWLVLRIRSVRAEANREEE